MALRTTNDVPLERLQDRVKRWDGNARITTHWNGFHKDPDLWFDDGDCFIHLYGAGQSQRGPSFRLVLSVIKSKYCGLSMGQIFGYTSRNDPKRHRHLIIPRPPPRKDDTNKQQEVYDLYLPAPTDKGKGETFKYHLVSRNILAWMCNKPIVGIHLGKALVALLERLNGYRSNEDVNLRDVLRYMNDMGYLDFRKCPDHALAILQFAEHFQMADLWADAFAHCLGMEDILRQSTEFELLSRASRLFIQRGVRDVRLRLEQAAYDLTTFFQDRLSETYLGLSDAARDHLDRFRSFLHTFYLGKYGQWPPPGFFDTAGGLHFPKEIYCSLYFDFRCLYEYLVDMESTPSMQDNKLVSGGLCVLQNVTAFDRRNGYQTLLHPLPLLPDNVTSNSNGTESSWVASLRPFGPARHILKAENNNRSHKLVTVGALLLARNNRLDLMATAIVQEYSRFEKLCTMSATEKVSAADGRKVRWLLIYTILQTLISVNEAPREVMQKEDVPYPLCSRIPNLRPWDLRGPGTHEFRMKTRKKPKAKARENDIRSGTSYPYYLNSRRPDTPTDISPGQRSSLSSVRNLRRLLSNASRRPSQTGPNNSRTATATAAKKKKTPAFCEIIVYGYGNGLNQTISETKPVLQRHETTRRSGPQQHGQVPAAVGRHINNNNIHGRHPRSYPSSSSTRSEYSTHPGLSDDSSSRDSTTTMTTMTTANTDTDTEVDRDRPVSKITVRHNSYTSLISNPYSSSSACQSLRETDEVGGVGEWPVYQAVRCDS